MTLKGHSLTLISQDAGSEQAQGLVRNAVASTSILQNVNSHKALDMLYDDLQVSNHCCTLSRSRTDAGFTT